MNDNNRPIIKRVLITALTVLALLALLFIFTDIGSFGGEGSSSSSDASFLEDVIVSEDIQDIEDIAQTEEPFTQAHNEPEPTVVAQASAEAGESQQTELLYSFRTQELYDSHYVKHGHEFGDITQEEYLQKANELIASVADTILKKYEDDGDLMYFNTATDEFLVLSPDGYIRTYFIPDDGIEYWERQ